MSEFFADDLKSRTAIADGLCKIVAKVRNAASVEGVQVRIDREVKEVSPEPGDQYRRYKHGPLETITIVLRHQEQS